MSLQISWSGLQRYEYCHHKHLRFTEGKALRSPYMSRDFLAGNVADRVEREWLRQADPQPGQMVAMVPDMLDRFSNPEREEPDFKPVRWKGDPREDRRQVLEFCTEVVSKLEPILLKHVVPYDYQPEVRFDTHIAVPYLDGRLVAVRLVGGIDIVVRMPNGEFVLFDLKATKNEAYIAKTLGQGIFYNVAWKHYWGEYPVQFGFIAPALDERLIWTVIGDHDRDVMRSRIMRFATGMWSGEWNPKFDNEGCNFCEVRHACDKYAIHLAPDDKGRHQASFEQALEARRSGRT